MSQSQEEYGSIEHLLTPAEAAAILRVGVPTLRRWTEQGKIDFSLTAGNRRRYSRAEVERVLKEGIGEDGDFYTPAQVAVLFRVDPRQVWKWANWGRIPFEKTSGGRRLYRKTVVHRLINDSAQQEGLV